MTTTIISTIETAQQSIGNRDTLVVLEGAGIVNGLGRAAEAFNPEADMINAGLITSEFGDTVLFSEGATTETITFRLDNLATGTILGANTGVFFSLPFTDEDNDDSAYINNAGIISAEQYSAVYIQRANNATVINSGLIDSEARGGGFASESGVALRDTSTGSITNSGTIVTASENGSSLVAAAVSVATNKVDADHSLVNTGHIQGASIGVYANGSNFDMLNSGSIVGDVEIETTSSVDVSNSGLIDGFISLFPDFGNVVNTADGQITGGIGAGSGTFFNLTNAGRIDTGIGVGANDVAINNSGEINGGISSFNTNFSMLNSGLIDARFNLVYLNNTDGSLTNSGTIFGDFFIEATSSFTYVNDAGGFHGGEIRFALDGVVTFENNGMVDGDILFGGGDDIYFGENGGTSYGSEIRMGSGDDVAFGGSGRDRIYDEGGDDDVIGGGGNDSFRAGGGANYYEGGEGYDYLSYYSFSTRVRIDLEAETTSGGGAGNAAGNDRFTEIEAVGGTNGGGDTLLGSSGRNSLFGWGGDDKLYGRGGNDKLEGGEGDDFFDGGGGTDLLIGGGGADRFQFDRGEGDDVIADFENNIDQLEFDNFSYLSTPADALAYATQVGSDVFFDFGADGTVLVLGVTTGQLANDIEIV